MDCIIGLLVKGLIEDLVARENLRKIGVNGDVHKYINNSVRLRPRKKKGTDLLFDILLDLKFKICRFSAWCAVSFKLPPSPLRLRRTGKAHSKAPMVPAHSR